MAVKLRLMRMGKMKQPTYRVVAADSRSPRDGRFIEIVGTYEPRQEPSRIVIDNAKALDWLRKGAVPSDTARSVFRKMGIMKHFHEGTTPSEAVSLHEGAHVVDRGYTAPGTKPKVAEAAAE